MFFGWRLSAIDEGRKEGLLTSRAAIRPIWLAGGRASRVSSCQQLQVPWKAWPAATLGLLEGVAYYRHLSFSYHPCRLSCSNCSPLPLSPPPPLNDDQPASKASQPTGLAWPGLASVTSGKGLAWSGLVCPLPFLDDRFFIRGISLLSFPPSLPSPPLPPLPLAPPWSICQRMNFFGISFQCFH